MESIATQPELELYPFAWPKFFLMAINQVIVVAWKNIVNTPGIEDYDEKKLNNLLHQELHDLWESNQLSYFTESQFSSPKNSGSYNSFDSSIIEASPDLIFELKVNQHGLVSNYYDKFFIECKIVDPNKSHQSIGATKGYLKNEGIMRFVTGKYAWASTQAGMIAYTKAGFSLMDYIDENGLPETSNFKQQIDNITVHNREFEYQGRSPGDISIYHFELKLDQSQ